MLSLWRWTIHRVHSRVHLVKRGGRGFLPGRQLPFGHGLAAVYRVQLVSRGSDFPRPWIWCKGASLWQWMCKLAIGGQRRKRPNGRVLLCGAVAFLWERERIGNEDVISCLKQYDDRVKSQLHVTLESSQTSTCVLPISCDEATLDQGSTSHFKNELQIFLQQKSKERLSQLPLVGLRDMGPISHISVRAQSALGTIRHKAAAGLNKAKKHIQVYSSLRAKLAEDSSTCDDSETHVSKQAEDSCGDTTLNVEMPSEQCHRNEEEDDVHSGVERNHEGAVKAKSLLEHYKNHSRRHMADLPLVGLRSPGYAYSLSVKIADSCQRLLGKESCSQASFLTHLGVALSDVPSIPPLPLAYTGLQLNSAAFVNEGLTMASVKMTVIRAVTQAWTLLIASPNAMFAVFDSMLGPEGELDSFEGERDREPKPLHHELPDSPQPLLPAQINAGTELLQSTPQIAGNTPTDTGSYLARCGWECFADAHNCTVYRKRHLTSGLYMYKVIGRYHDISVNDFVDVQVDHDCRKRWDTYVQKLETVDVDDETGTEVVHWIMGFPFPMSSREYLYVRRVWIHKNAAVLIGRAVDHPAVPECKKYVRVQDYDSKMVMQPHTTTDQEGFEFELTYFDDPKTNLPSSCVNWVATTAMPDFLAKVHTAALQRRDASPSSSGLPTISSI